MAMTLADLKGKTVGACVSGGLDSRTIAKVMVEAGVHVVAFSADLGQPDEKDINDIKKRMAPCGVDTVIIDLKEPMAEACFQVIEAQAMYDGGYWNSTGIARMTGQPFSCASCDAAKTARNARSGPTQSYVGVDNCGGAAGRSSGLYQAR